MKTREEFFKEVATYYLHSSRRCGGAARGRARRLRSQLLTLTSLLLLCVKKMFVVALPRVKGGALFHLNRRTRALARTVVGARTMVGVRATILPFSGDEDESCHR